MIQKIVHHIVNFIQNRIHIILPLITLCLVILLVCSYLIPKKVIDTYRINTTEDEGDTEQLLSLEEGTVVTYHMNTGTRPIMGMHIGIGKNGNVYETAAIICNVYTDDGTLVSENGYLLSQGEDMQYIYIPFQNYTQCFGDIYMEFTYQPGNDTGVSAPGILTNGKELTNAYTEMNGNKLDGNIKTIYIYTHDTYPLVYDLRILVVLFFAASMAVNYGKMSDGKNPLKKDNAEQGMKKAQCQKQKEEEHVDGEQEGVNETNIM